MDTTVPPNQASRTSKPPLLTRIRERLRDARDEYIEYIEEGQNRAAAQRRPKRQSREDHSQRHKSEQTETGGVERNTNAATGTQSHESSPTKVANSGHERKENEQHKKEHSRDMKSKSQQEPDNRGHRKHKKPAHHRPPHEKHKPSALEEVATSTEHLVERLVRRIEKGIHDESVQVEYLQDAAQRLFRIAEGKGKSLRKTDTADGPSKAPRSAGHTSEIVEDIAEGFVEQARELEEGTAHQEGGGNGAALVTGAEEEAESRLSRAIRRKHGHEERRQDRGDVSPVKDKDRRSVSSLSSEEGERK
ncbi:hypothetical protein MMC11_002344 [Xylographa trunciseda]|nr:hypothetical protein [Xylographa trunciseda]